MKANILSIILVISTLSTGLASHARSNYPPNNSEEKTDENRLTEAQIDSLERAAYGNVKSLEELVVTADAPMIKVSANQITYNVDEDPSAGGSTVLDILRKVPMVSVDGQDNIRVKGNGDFKIYVNGRPEPLLSQNASLILKSMPAETVASVELITDPGAKYDAEGSGAIINLVTERKQSNNGFNGSANLSVDNRMLQAGVNGAAKFNRFNLNAGANYSYGFRGSRKANMLDETIYHNNPTEHRLRETSKNSQDVDFLGFDLGGSWDISDHDLLTFSANYYDVSGKMHITEQSSEMYSSNNSLLWSYSRNALLNLKFRGASVQTSYQHEFGRKDNYLGISYMFNFSDAGLPGVYTYGNLNNYFPDYIYQRNENTNISREHTLQIDWADAINPHARIEVGGKSIFRYNSAFGNSSVSNDLVLYQLLDGTETNMRQPQNIYALYGIYTALYGNFAGQAGVRYEHTYMGIRYPSDADKNFTSRLNDVVPNASLTYSFSPANTLSLNYSMRISRPSIRQLNPYPLELSNLRVQQGNPDLTSERINKVSISYNNFKRVFGGSITADYSDSNNAITTLSVLDGYRLINTYANIGHNRTASVSLFLMWSPTSKLRFTMNAGGNYTDLKADKDIDGKQLANHGFSGNFYLNADWNLPEKFNLGAFGGLNSGNVSLMGKSGNYHYYGLNLSRKFLKDDSLKISLNAMNFFEKYNSFTNTTTSADFTTKNVWKNPSWTVGVSATWNFGKNKADVKSVNSSIVNDDISSTKSAGSIGN